MPETINPSTVFSGALSAVPGYAASGYNIASQYNPQYTGLNLSNYRSALLGSPSFNAQAFLADHPDIVSNWNSDPGYQQVYGSLDNYAQAHYNAWGGNDPRYVQYNSSNAGAAGLSRLAYDQANPELAAYTRGLGGTLADLNGRVPNGYNASLMNAANAGPAALASGVTASGGPLLRTLQNSATYNLDRVSPVQSALQRQAVALSLSDGNLTPGEMANVQDSVRAAYADRGLLRSNSGIGAEILQTDQARRQRMFQNAQFAQGIDSSGQQQLQANRNYALGVQGQGQNLSQFNAGLLTSTNTFNAGQTNQVGQYNAGLLQQAGLYNAGALNDAGRFNTTLQTQNVNDAWNRYMGYGNFQLSQAQNPNAIAMGLMGQAPDYTGQLLNTTSQIADYNANAVNAAAIARGNNNASMTGAAIGGVATIGAGIAIAF